MGEDAVDFADRGSGDGNEIVADAQEDLAFDSYIVCEQKIEVLGDGTGQGIFDGNGGGLYGTVGDGRKGIGGEREGDNDSIVDQIDGGLMTE